MTRRRRFLVWFVPWAWPLLATAGTVWAVWAVFRRGPVGRDTDSWILVGIGAVYAFAALAILLGTRRWDSRALGQLLTYLGDAGFYGVIGASRFGWRGGLSGAEVDLIRALFVVGGALLGFGLLFWLGRTRGGTREPAARAADPPAEDRLLYEGPDRRGTLPGRRSGDRR